MTNRQIDNRIKKLQELERQRKEIEQKENELKAEIKRDLESKDIEEDRQLHSPVENNHQQFT